MNAETRLSRSRAPSPTLTYIPLTHTPSLLPTHTDGGKRFRSPNTDRYGGGHSRYRQGIDGVLCTGFHRCILALYPYRTCAKEGSIALVNKNWGKRAGREKEA